MKQVFRIPIALLLAMCARMILRKYKPQVIMITGSVGKTSTKDATYAALSKTTFVRASEKSYNSEFGVPLTIIGAKNPWTSMFAWLQVFGEALALIFLPNHYPKTLVLEVGADRPGDLARILRIVAPDAVIVTRLPEVPVHVEAYTTPAAVREEEFAPAYALSTGAPLILSSLDTYAVGMAKNTQANITLFGFSPEAAIHITQPEVVLEEGVPVGMKTTATVDGRSFVLHAKGALGRPQVLAPAAAFALTYALGIAPKDALAGLEQYLPPPGRARIIRGLHNSLIIDDTYNASPAAMEEALETLTLLPKNTRHIAVLGDMLELGRYSLEEHERIGALAAKDADILIAVGIRSRAMMPAALAAGMQEDCIHAFDNAIDAARALKDMLQPRDTLLIKGSQSMRMERIVEALLANPADTSLLVRQDKEWKRR